MSFVENIYNWISCHDISGAVPGGVAGVSPGAGPGGLSSLVPGGVAGGVPGN